MSGLTSRQKTLGRVVLASAIMGAVAGATAQLSDATPAGRLDRSFGDNGRVLTDFRGNHDHANAVAIDRSGLLIAGRAASKMALIRYREDGDIARGFGAGGSVVIKRIGGHESSRASATVTGGGRILLAGTAGNDFALVRLHRDGRRDRSFGQRGAVSTELPTGNNILEDAAIQSNGKIVVVGHSDGDGPADDQLVLARYRHNGRLDRSFADSGILYTQFGASADVRGNAVALQDDGKIVVGGTASNNWIVARFRRAGQPDPGFSGDGVNFSAPLLIGEAFDVAIQPNGRIVAGGTDFGGDSRFAVGRYMPDGQFDEDFGEGGAQHTTFGPMQPSEAAALAIQRNGRILLAGVGTTAPSSEGGLRFKRFALARYRKTGQPDSSFGGDGTVLTSFRRRSGRRHDDTGTDVAIQANGRIVAAGSSRAFGQDHDFAVARYLTARKP
jgi:uncharacterized delta-60 repeat protein